MSRAHVPYLDRHRALLRGLATLALLEDDRRADVNGEARDTKQSHVDVELHANLLHMHGFAAALGGEKVRSVHAGLLLVCAAAHGKGFLGVCKQSLP